MVFNKCMDWIKLFYCSTTQEEADNEEGEPTAEEAKKVTLPRGTVLKLSNLPVGTSRDDIRAGFTDLPADIAFVEINERDRTAFIRLRGENDGKLVPTAHQF